MIRHILFCFLWSTVLLLGPLAQAECLAKDERFLLISDRFTAATPTSDLWIGVNGPFLTIRQRGTSSFPVRAIYEASGDILDFSYHGDTLTLAIASLGISVINWNPQKNQLVHGDTQPIPGLVGANLTRGSKPLAWSDVNLWTIEDGHQWPLPEVGVKEALWQQNHLWLLSRDGKLMTSSTASGQWTLLETPFDLYRIHTNDQGLLCDTTLGLSFLTFSELVPELSDIPWGGTFDVSPFLDNLLPNQGARIILNSALLDQDLLLQFSEGFEWRSLSEPGLTLGRLPLRLSQVGVPTMGLNEDAFWLINKQFNLAGWSLQSFERTAPEWTLKETLVPKVDRLAGFTLRNNQLLLAVDQGAYLIPWEETTDLVLEDLTPVATFDWPINEVHQTLFGAMLVLNNLDERQTELSFFEIGNTLFQEQSRFVFSSAPRDIQSTANSVAFYTEEDDQEGVLLHYLHLNDLGSWEHLEQSFTQARHPSLAPTSQGLFLAEQETVWYLDGTSLEWTASWELNASILDLERFGNGVLIQSEEGIHYLDLSMRSPMPLTGWWAMNSTKNGFALVQTQEMQHSGQWYSLNRSESGLFFPNIRVFLGETPTHIDSRNFRMLVSSNHCLKALTLVCPSLNHEWLWPPFEQDLCLSVNTAQTEGHVVKWTSYTSSGQAQHSFFLPAAEFLEANSKGLEDWPVLSHNDATAAVLIQSSFPLYPVLKSTAEPGRDGFAFNASNALTTTGFIPHIPDPRQYWQTSVTFHANPFSPAVNLIVGDLDHQFPWTASAQPQTLAIYDGSSLWQSWAQPPQFLALTADTISAAFGGFYLISREKSLALSGSALHTTMDTLFQIPNLAQAMQQSWQGVVLDNPQPKDIIIRKISWDNRHQVLADQSVTLSAGEKHMFLLTSTNEDPSWVDILTEEPVLATCLIGSSEWDRIADFSPHSSFSRQLIGVGLFRSDAPDSHLNLVLANGNTAQNSVTLTFYDQHGEALQQFGVTLGYHEIQSLSIAEMVENALPFNPPHTVVVSAHYDCSGFLVEEDPPNGWLNAYRLNPYVP
jgi:hypothetical protein